LNQTIRIGALAHPSSRTSARTIARQACDFRVLLDREHAAVQNISMKTIRQ
jgi:hypothetical protein